MVNVKEHTDIITMVLQDSLIELLIEKEIITKDEIESVFGERLDKLKTDLNDLKESTTSEYYFGLLVKYIIYIKKFGYFKKKLYIRSTEGKI